MKVFLISALDGGEWSTSLSGRLTLRERAPTTHCIGEWMDFTPGMETVVAKRKIFSLY
jgi:hypothetical protein